MVRGGAQRQGAPQQDQLDGELIVMELGEAEYSLDLNQDSSEAGVCLGYPHPLSEVLGSSPDSPFNSFILGHSR